MKDFSAEHQGKRLRIEFTNGEVCDAELLLLCTGDEHANCCGTIFDLHKTNHPEKNQYALQSTPPAAVWSELEFVKSFELLEKEVA